MHPFHRQHPARPWAITTLILLILLVLGAVRHIQVVNKFHQEIKTLKANPSAAAPATPVTQTPPATDEPDPETTAYANTRYNYQLAYPKNYQIKEYQPDRATIGLITGGGEDELVNGKVELAVMTPNTGAEAKLKLKDFMFNRIKLLCDADGGGVSVTCPSQKNLKSLTIASGLPAYALTLAKEERTFGPEASVIKDEAVFFVVDLSANNKRTILVIHAVGDGTAAQAEAVMKSVKQQ